MQDGKQPEGLIGGTEQRAIIIAAYDPGWPQRFAAHADLVRRALGAIALQIEHIGSTSVPGLAAKPIIDMLVVVPDAGDEASWLPALERAGYQLRVREPAFHQHRMLRTPERDVHLHVFPPDAPEIDRYLRFRDRLRTDAQDRQLYEQTKRTLAARQWPDMNAYADAKGSVVEAIIARAHGPAPASTAPHRIAHYAGQHREIAQCFFRSVREVASGVYTAEQVAAWAPEPINDERWRWRCELKRPFLALVDERVAGFLELDTDGHIDCHYVHPDHVRRGIGSALLRHAVDIAERLRLPRLHLEASHLIRPLYERQGFHVVRPNVVECRGVRIENWIMERRWSS